MRISRLVGLVVIGFLLAGCYTLEPAGGVAPEVGTSIALDLNDAGRAALGGAMGPEIDQIEGRLVSREADGSDLLIAVSVVRLLRGGEQTWRGEQVHIKSEYFTKVYLRRYSAGRTIALSAAGIGAVAILATTAIVIAANPTAPDNKKCETLCGTARRLPRPRSIPKRFVPYNSPPLRTP